MNRMPFMKRISHTRPSMSKKERIQVKLVKLERKTKLLIKRVDVLEKTVRKLKEESLLREQERTSTTEFDTWDEERFLDILNIGQKSIREGKQLYSKNI